MGLYLMAGFLGFLIGVVSGMYLAVRFKMKM